MTDKARELLERALKGLENRKDEVADWGAYASEYFQNKWGYEDSIVEFDGLMEEIRAYLAEPEAKRKKLSDEEIFNLYNEHEEETSVHSTIFHFNEFARAIEARVLQREPLKKEQIEKGFQETGYREGESRGRCFVLGVRFAEKHHGIGGGDE